MIYRTLLFAVAGAVSAAGGYAQTPRDVISIVGSSTVYPFATTVAERFANQSGLKTPTVESTDTGSGFKLFCGGVGVDYPDINNASRPIKLSEIQTCADNGVTEIIEIEIGYGGIVLVNAKQADQYQLNRKDIYLALAARVPDPNGSKRLITNPYTRWRQVNAELPDYTIDVLGPPPASGTRDALVELVMNAGCKAFAFLAALEQSDNAAFTAACQTLREDGTFVETGENDNLIVQKLAANPNTVGIFGYSFLEQNLDRLHGSLIDGVEPTFESIAAGEYTVSRPLFFYVKKAHIGAVPGLQEYMTEFTSDAASGENGYLIDKGLIPLPAEQHRQMQTVAERLAPLEPTLR